MLIYTLVLVGSVKLLIFASAYKAQKPRLTDGSEQQFAGKPIRVRCQSNKLDQATTIKPANYRNHNLTSALFSFV